MLAGCGNGAESGPDAAVSPPDVGSDAGSDVDRVLRSVLAAKSIRGDAAAGRVIPSGNEPLVALGRSLFFSRALSGDFDVACASCHHPALAGADGLSLPVGVGAHDPMRVGPGRHLDPMRDADPRTDGGPNGVRNTPTTFNASLFDRSLFADGRVASLAVIPAPGGAGASITTPDVGLGLVDVAAGPDLVSAAVRFEVVDRVTMRGFGDTRSDAEHRSYLAARLRGETADAALLLRNEWVARFRTAYGEPTRPAVEVLTFDRIAEAVGAYLRSQTFVEHAFARYVRGDDAALDEAAKRGAIAFFTPTTLGGAGCVSCHAGEHFSDEQFHAVGFPQIGRGVELSRADFGRSALQGGIDENRYAFRTPSLLSVAETAPYGHAGTFARLEDVVRHHLDAIYAADVVGFDGAALPQFAGTGYRYPHAEALTRDALQFLSPGAPTGATADVEDLVAFLRSLSDPCVVDRTCVVPLLPTPADDADGLQLVAALDPPAGVWPLDPGPHPWPGEAASSSPAPSNVGLDLRGLICPDRTAPFALGSSTFVDVTTSAGLEHVHGFDASRFTGVESADLLLATAGVAAGDLDGDCHPDLAFTAGDGGGIQLYRSMRGLGMAPVATALPSTAGPLASGITIVDLDGDRRSEIVIGVLGPGGVEVLEGGPEDGYRRVAMVPSERSTFGAAAGDVDGDGRLDLALGHWDARFSIDASPLIVRQSPGFSFASHDRALGVGAFASAVATGYNPALLDLDGDRTTDLALVADFRRTTLALGRGGGLVDVTDRAVVDDTNGMGSAFGDFDGDLDLDWFVTSIDIRPLVPSVPEDVSGNRMYRNDGAGVLTDVTGPTGVRAGAWGWGACAADFDNDGDLDLFHVNGWANVPASALQPEGPLPSRVYTANSVFVATVPRLFENQGDGTFVDAAAAWGLDGVRQGRGVACGDLDRDGDVDLAVAVHSGPPAWLQNQRGSGPGHRFVEVRTVGPVGNSDALGARVLVRADGRTRLRQVERASHHLSHDPAAVHVGLGAALWVDEIRVVWPDGAADTVLPPGPSNRFVIVRHPSLDVTASLDGAHRARLTSLAGLAFARVDRTDVNDAALPVLATMLRGYGLAVSFDTSAELLRRVAAAVLSGDGVALAELRLSSRYLFRPSIATSADLATRTGTSALVAVALHCPDAPLPASFASDLAAAAEAGGAASVDALEAFALATANDCGEYLDRPRVAALLSRSLATVSIDDGAVDREELRVLSVVAHLGREDAIPRELLLAVVDAAQPDGSFGASQPLDGSVVPLDDLATVRAAWLFAALTHHGRALTALAP